MHGWNNTIKIGNGVLVGVGLKVIVGNDSLVQIGNGTTIQEATINCSYGEIQIGGDCLFSSGIDVRNHDGHHIFDKNGVRKTFQKILLLKIMYGLEKTLA